MNYIDALAHRLGQTLDDCEIDLLRAYAVLALTLGADVTEEDVHHSWAAWRASTQPDHPALVPFHELAPGVQALDTKYAEAIRAVAA